VVVDLQKGVSVRSARRLGCGGRRCPARSPRPLRLGRCPMSITGPRNGIETLRPPATRTI
jgi:hypothetical protein